VHLASQFPHESRAVISRITGVPLHQVRVIVGDVGGGFGQKAYLPHDEQIVVLAAVKLRRTIKWIEDRGENLTAATQSRHEQMAVTMAVDDNGVILGAYVDHMADIGAHPVFTTGGGAVFVCMVFPGPYRVPRFGFRSTSVFTNTCSRGAYRGPWQVESVAREAMMDEIARQLELDPVEVRRVNVLRPVDLPYASPGGLVIHSVSPADSLEHAVEMIGYDSVRGAQDDAGNSDHLVGVGIALYVEPQPGRTSAGDGISMRITPDGRIEVAQASGDHGQGLTTTSAQIVADAIGVDVSDVVVRQGDTAVAPYGGGTGGSRSGPMLGAALLETSTMLRERIFDHAADQLECSPDDLEMRDGAVTVRGTPTIAIALESIARSAYKHSDSATTHRGLSVVNHFDAPVPFAFSNACHICVVDVHRRTGVTTVRRYVVSEDCGNMINPAIVDGQISGGVLQGIGGALYEHVVYDDAGNPLTGTFVDYLMPTIAEAPLIEIGHRPTPGATPGGFKGVGEGGVIGAVPAVLNAVADALARVGAVVPDQPLTPPRLLEAITLVTQGAA
jgi:carbon-monoxide dehydrogenase large subunit